MIAFLNQRSGMTSGCADWLDRFDAVGRFGDAAGDRAEDGARGAGVRLRRRASIPWVLGTGDAKATGAQNLANSVSTGLSDRERGSYAPRMLNVGGGGRRQVSFERFENEGGSCPECSRGAELWTCSECGTSAWVIDCADRRGPAWLRRGRSDGSASKRVFCGECADVL